MACCDIPRSRQFRLTVRLCMIYSGYSVEREAQPMASTESGSDNIATPEVAKQEQRMRVSVRHLPVNDELTQEIQAQCRRLGVWRRKYVQEIEDELKLRYHFGGKYVAYLPSEHGLVVVAAGELESAAFDEQLACLSSQERQSVVLDAVDRWNDQTSLILSHSPSHEDEPL
jgi:hypothetical protein